MRIRTYLLSGLACCSMSLLAQNVGIGTATPTERLHVEGNLRLQGAFMPNNLPGANGNILLSSGPGVPPVWLPNGAIGTILMIGPGGTPVWAPNPICASPTQDRHLRVAATTPTLSVCNSTLAENATGNIWNADGNATPVAAGDKFEIIATAAFPYAVNGYAGGGYGVYGEATGTNGVGVFGITNQATGRGVVGVNTNANGTAGYFENTANAGGGGGDGVVGVTHQTGGNGVWAVTDQAASIGALWATNTAAAGTGIGLGAAVISQQRGGSALGVNMRNGGPLLINYFSNAVISAIHFGGTSGGGTPQPPAGIVAQVQSGDNNARAILGQHLNGPLNVNAYSVMGIMDRGGNSTGTNWAVGVFGQNPGFGTNDWAVYSNGWFGATLGKGFLIDHPLDPENKYLLHACTEGPEPYNLYRGVVTTDAQGRAVVELPAYFEAINRDYTYHLTPIGAFAQAIVAEEIQNNRFVIQTDKPHVKVAWMVLGVRNDPAIRYAWKPTEFEKAPEHRGKYLIPQVYGKGEEYSIFPGPVKAQELSRPAKGVPALSLPEEKLRRLEQK